MLLQMAMAEPLADGVDPADVETVMVLTGTDERSLRMPFALTAWIVLGTGVSPLAS
jgi:hypothetical protein